MLSDLIAWADIYEATNGFRPDSLLTSNRVLRLMQRNKEVIDAVAGAQTGRTRANLNELNDLLESEGLPTVRPSYGTKVDVDGVTVAVIPDDRVIFLPPNIADLGYVAMGLSATALELVNSGNADLSFEEAPGIVAVIEKIGPPYRQFTYVDAVGMPVLSAGRLLMVADAA